MPINQNLDLDYIGSVVEIHGLRSHHIRMDATGMIDFGCIKKHCLDLRSATNEEIEACAGPVAVQWWNKYKNFIIGFFEWAYNARVDLEEKFETELNANPLYLEIEAWGDNIGTEQLKRDMDPRCRIYIGP